MKEEKSVAIVDTTHRLDEAVTLSETETSASILTLKHYTYEFTYYVPF